PAEHDAVGGRDPLGVGGDLGLDPDVLQRLLDAAPVAHAVVDDRQSTVAERSFARHAVSVPLVDGTPRSFGSIDTATRSARASALIPASIMWWAPRPRSIS